MVANPSTCCSNQFKITNFKLSNIDEESFYVSSWKSSRVLYACIRSLFLVWALVWIVWPFPFPINSHPHVRFTKWTNWNELLVFLYYLLAFIAALYGSKCPKTPLQGFLWILHKATWALQSVCFTASFYIVILYWAMMAQYDVLLTSPRNLYRHGLIFAALLIDIFICNIPVRILHFIYAINGMLWYAIFMIIWQLSGNGPIYPFLDLYRRPFFSAIFIVVVVLIGPIISQIILYVLYLFKSKLCCALSTRYLKGLPVSDEQSQKTEIENV